MQSRVEIPKVHNKGQSLSTNFMNPGNMPFSTQDKWPPSKFTWKRSLLSDLNLAETMSLTCQPGTNPHSSEVSSPSGASNNRVKNNFSPKSATSDRFTVLCKRGLVGKVTRHIPAPPNPPVPCFGGMPKVEFSKATEWLRWLSLQKHLLLNNLNSKGDSQVLFHHTSPDPKTQIL